MEAGRPLSFDKLGVVGFDVSGVKMDKLLLPMIQGQPLSACDEPLKVPFFQV